MIFPIVDRPFLIVSYLGKGDPLQRLEIVQADNLITDLCVDFSATLIIGYSPNYFNI